MFVRNPEPEQSIRLRPILLVEAGGLQKSSVTW
jgi:hypothetical protein